jgi:hypothetical protein
MVTNGEGQREGYPGSSEGRGLDRELASCLFPIVAFLSANIQRLGS